MLNKSFYTWSIGAFFMEFSNLSETRSIRIPEKANAHVLPSCVFQFGSCLWPHVSYSCTLSPLSGQLLWTYRRNFLICWYLYSQQWQFFERYTTRLKFINCWDYSIHFLLKGQLSQKFIVCSTLQNQAVGKIQVSCETIIPHQYLSLAVFGQDRKARS